MPSSVSRPSDVDTKIEMYELEWRQTPSWNSDGEACSNGYYVPQLVLRQAALTPQSTAVAACNESITYAELEERASQIAGALRSLGVGQDDLVAICLPRSVAQVVSALGVFMAGAA